MSGPPATYIKDQRIYISDFLKLPKLPFPSSRSPSTLLTQRSSNIHKNKWHYGNNEKPHRKRPSLKSKEFYKSQNLACRTLPKSLSFFVFPHSSSLSSFWKLPALFPFPLWKVNRNPFNNLCSKSQISNKQIENS